MNEEHVKEVFSDEEFVKDLFASKSLEEAQKKLLDKDIDLSTEDIQKVIELIKKHPDGQLTEEELESVNGGSEFIDICLTLFLVGLCSGTITSVIYS